MSAIMTFDSTLSMSDVAARHPEHIPVRCVSADSSSKASVFALLMPQDAQVCALTAALQDFLCTPKGVQVFLDGAVPSRNTELRDLCMNGGVSLAYSTEGVYGGTIVATPCGGAGTW